MPVAKGAGGYASGASKRDKDYGRGTSAGGGNAGSGREGGNDRDKNILKNPPQIPNDPPGIDVPDSVGNVATPVPTPEPMPELDTAPAQRRPRRRAGLGIPSADHAGITGASGVFIP